LLDNVEKGVLFQQVTDPTQRERVGAFLATDFLVNVVDTSRPEAVLVCGVECKDCKRLQNVP